MALNQEQRNTILDAGHRVVLDGTATVKDLVTSFDAHEQAARGVHIPTAADSPDVHSDDIQEYPKAVDHVEVDGHLEPVVATSAEHEAQLNEQIATQKEEGKK